MWSLFNGEKSLEPLVFSNGKSQKDIVNEIVESINQGYKIIFIEGKCGTGKSAIALNLARILGKTSIVVPIKSLQEQYIKDYSDKLYVLDKENKNKLKISSILGRKNFKCNFIKENKLPGKIHIEENKKLTDIFGNRKNSKQEDVSCDNDDLPCKIEIKEKNINKIKHYLKQNPLVKINDFSSINNVKRMSIAPVCEYYSPILPEELEINFKNSMKISYQGLNNQRFNIHQRKPGCPFYEQYQAYANSDVIIFNSLKYKLETLMNRKPETELEIIDECDEFLDSFANIETINVNRLLLSLSMAFAANSSSQKIINELILIINTIKKKYADSDEILEISETLIEELLRTILKNHQFINEIEVDEESYLFHLDEVAKIFYDFLSETFFSIEKKDNDLIINLITTNLKKRFQELLKKNKIIIMMSGTIHSKKVLENIFGLENFKIVEAETNHQGKLIKCRNGYEIDCKYSNFKSEKITREKYLKTFSKTINCAKKPILVHLTSFSDLPTEHEKELFKIDNLPSQSELFIEQDQDPLSKRVIDFKNKKTEILFTTKCNRGIDFPGDVCNSIVISRFPYPNVSSLFWKILKKTNPDDFFHFYLDKANRELLQKIYRGLRSKNDRVYLFSPDSRVLDFEI